MCGRTCLTLNPDQVCCACRYRKKGIKKETTNGKAATVAVKKEPAESNDKVKHESAEHIKEEPVDDEYVNPEWRSEFNLGRSYQASYNIAPTDITPVLVSAAHFSDDKDENYARLVVPMLWGMIPFWHKGDYRKHGLTTNNCRLEHLMNSKLYGGPFRRGQRCVVLCEGFYEWQTTKSAKPSERDAYLVYVPQEDNVKIYDKNTWSPENVKLLRMAGLFDVWEDGSGDKIYSYSVITFESNKIMSWMHHRMPAILETEDQVNDWLDFRRVSDGQALATLRPANELLWHRVPKLVNNSRNKSSECNKPLELVSKPVRPPMNKTMLAWLNTRKQREEQIKAELSSQCDELEAEEEEQNAAKRNATESPAKNDPKRPRFRDFKTAARRSGNSSAANNSSNYKKVEEES